ncbi:MAG TPA: hypothetical protein VGI45_20335 [Terracidiphilus sp.]|jgi:hypothetical protein
MSFNAALNPLASVCSFFLLAEVESENLLINVPIQMERLDADVHSLDDGRQVVISWPSSLPAYEAESIKAWRAIVEKKIARSATQPEEPKEAAE